jgi:three-Cys-motif partner protein
MSEDFFEEPTEQSIVKAEIVEKYFKAWASIITATQDKYGKEKNPKIGYVDLFAGPGRYEDGAISTPLRVLKKAIGDTVLSKRLVTIFNDKDEANIRSLKEAISELPNISNLKYEPVFWNEEIGDEIAKDIARTKKIPVLAFIDPWGYKGLSLNLVNSFLKDWGCDCIFFFNYFRINAGLNNPCVKEHMESLFGERTEELSNRLKGMGPPEREATIINELSLGLKDFGHRFVLPFCFKNKNGKRTTHHIIFVSKSFKGYEVMKEIMANASSEEHQGVPSFVFSPACGPQQLFLFELNRPIDDLRDMLLNNFKGKRMTMENIYKTHCMDRPYLKRHYREVLANLEQDGKIKTFGRKSKKGFPDYILVEFP